VSVPQSSIGRVANEPQDHIVEWNWDNTTTTGKSGSLTQNTITAGSQTRLTAYWPFIIWEDSSNNLQEIVYDCTVPECWSMAPVNVSASANGGLVIVPQTQNLTEMDVFYQRDDGKVVDYSRNSTSGLFATGMYSFSFPISLRAPANCALHSWNLFGIHPLRRKHRCLLIRAQW
jgi:hypothetical protein